MFCPLWFGANYFFNLSLGLTSVASNTILSTTSGIFTLVLSVFILRESPEILKFFAVSFAFGGVAWIALSDETAGESGFIGDIFAIVGAIFYASYSVLLKAKGEDLDMIVLFGFTGVTNIVMFLAGIIILNYTGVEVFEIPNGIEAGFIIINAVFGTVLSDVLWAMSVLYLNPTLCSVALSLTIPLAVIADVVLYDLEFNYYYIIGAVLVIVGFVIMSLFESEKLGPKMTNQYLKNKFCRRHSD